MLTATRFPMLFAFVATSLITILMLPSNAEAAAYMKFEGIEGEATDAKHDKWIDVLSVDWGTNRGGGRSTARAPRDGSSGTLTITKTLDRSSPKLQQACASGAHFPEVELDLSASARDRGSRTTYLTYKLHDVLVTSCSTGGSGGEDRSTETISLNFAKIEWTYDKGERGKVEATRKIEEGTK